MPVRLLGVAAICQPRDRLVVEARGDLGCDEHGVRLGQSQFATVQSHLHVVDFEVDQVAAAVADVVAPGADAFAPVVVSQSAVEFDVRAAKPDAFAVYAGEVGLAADARAETAVECVIPKTVCANSLLRKTRTSRILRGLSPDRCMECGRGVWEVTVPHYAPAVEGYRREVRPQGGQNQCWVKYSEA